MSAIESWNFDEIMPRVDNAMGVSVQLPSEAMTIRRTVMRSEASTPDHTHPYDQVVIVYEGEMAIASDGMLYPLSKGMLLRIPAGTTHRAAFKAGCDFMELGLGVDRGLVAGVERPALH